MKDKIIKFIKKHPFFYNLAKKVNRKLNRVPPKKEYSSSFVYFTYQMENLEELEKIRKHFNAIKNNNSKLFIIIKNKDYQIEMNRIMRENLDILFADLNYFEKYQKKLGLGNLLLLDYRIDYSDILKYLY